MAARQRRAEAHEAAEARWQARARALYGLFVPLSSRFACWTNRRLCWACFLACVPPALAFVLIPLLSERRPWPMSVLDRLNNPFAGLLAVPGFVCTFGMFLSLLDAFSAYGSKFAGHDDEGDAIMNPERYQCPHCSIRWKWCNLPAFSRSYQCPECRQVRRVPKSAGPRSYTLLFGICAFVGSGVLVVLHIRG